MTTENKPPLPPFTEASAITKVRITEDAWNSRDPDHVIQVYTHGTLWRNRAEFPRGREEVRAILTRKWARELDYRLIKELWPFTNYQRPGKGLQLALVGPIERHGNVHVRHLQRCDDASLFWDGIFRGGRYEIDHRLNAGIGDGRKVVQFGLTGGGDPVRYPTVIHDPDKVLSHRNECSLPPMETHCTSNRSDRQSTAADAKIRSGTALDDAQSR